MFMYQQFIYIGYVANVLQKSYFLFYRELKKIQNYKIIMILYFQQLYKLYMKIVWSAEKSQATILRTIFCKMRILIGNLSCSTQFLLEQSKNRLTWDPDSFLKVIIYYPCIVDCQNHLREIFIKGKQVDYKYSRKNILKFDWRISLY